MLRTFFTGFLCLVLGTALAQTPAAPQQTAEQFAASLQFKTGKIVLPGAIATLDLPPTFRYLGPQDTERLLVEGWGNPPGTTTLGMIVPAKVNPVSREGWGVIVTYDQDGHVKDDDAENIKYDELLKQMQEGTADNNAARKEQGFPAMTLVGWAEAPRYERASHKLYWAKELRTEGSEQNGLNYNIRVLGRTGVLVLNAVAGMDQLAQVKAEMPQVTAFTNFTEGNRYADFDSKTDKVAEYGIATLVAGGIAAKLGFFGKLLALLVAFKKLILLGLLAAGSMLFKFFKREKKVDLSK
ncbi:MAG TPA: DUF2167 domain-containing protein [Telluria sp.]